jgi:hypothetical protein
MEARNNPILGLRIEEKTLITTGFRYGVISTMHG